MEAIKLAGANGQKSKLEIKGVTFGGAEIILIGGPCAVESREQMRTAAQAVKAAGGRVLRGGIYKPRTSPYSFQGLGKEGLNYLVDAAAETGLLTVTEILDEEGLAEAGERVDIIQVGARNMQNFQLLKRLGKINKPVILKRGLAATVEEWLCAAEYILSGGNSRVILCERGIRTFETSTRNTLDLGAVAVTKELSHLPVIVDPSHAAGRKDIIPALAKAALAGGADGLMIEMHPNPTEAKSDGAQSLTPEEFRALADELRQVAGVLGRSMEAGMNGVSDLNSLRAKIDTLDRNIVALITTRIEIVKQIGNYKNAGKIRDARREKEVIERLLQWTSELKGPAGLVKLLYQQIFDYGVQLQIQNTGKKAQGEAVNK